VKDISKCASWSCSFEKTFRIGDRFPEDVAGLGNIRALEVRVARDDVSQKRLAIILVKENSPIHANEVRSLDNNLVGAINPSSPSVNVSDLSLHTNRANHTPHIVNAVGESVGVAVLPVQVLAADGNGNDPILAMGGDGIKQSLLLGLEVVDVFGPDADEDLGAGVEGGGHGVGESVAVRAGVEADGCDVLGETLQFVEGGGPLGGGLAGSIGVVCTVVCQ
jgi:hypothetical protein